MNNQPEIKDVVETSPVAKGKRVPSGTVAFVALLLIVTIAITALATFSYTMNHFCHVTDENAAKLQTINKLLDENAYYDLSYDDMIDAALKAYVGAAGDRYTVYYNADEYAKLTEENEGKYVGIGVTSKEVTISYNGNEVAVLEVVRLGDDSPAKNGGISEGDYIYAIYAEDGLHYINDLGMSAAAELIRGEAGTAVKLQWLSKSGDAYKMHETEFTRAAVATVSVEYAVSETDPSVGIVSVYQFDLTTPVQFCNAFDTLKQKGIERIVIDLRDNGGGDLLSVIACASYFVETGDIIITAEDKDGNVDDRRAVRRHYSDSYATCSVSDEDIGKYRNFKVAVLVNQNTASAAELLTAVFRDYQLAPVIGVQTFGKGTMQTLIPLDQYGLEGGLKVTTSHYYPPCGESYNGIGISPDIVVELPEGSVIANLSEQEDTQLCRAIRELAEK